MYMFRKKVRQLLKTILLVLIINFIVFEWFIIPVRVDGDSMFPTLKDGNMGISFMFHDYFDDVERFDVVIVKINGNEDLIVKRVIGLPNEELSYSNDTLYIDGVAIDEPFLDSEYRDQIIENSKRPFTYRMPSYQLKNDEYFVLGDNRPRSRDSRYFGPVKDFQIVSKGFIKFR